MTAEGIELFNSSPAQEIKNPSKHKDAIYCNTTSQYPTHFLAAVPLIVQARGDFSVSSENWSHPTYHYIGQTTDPYYAEVWVDGMDWKNTYWVIEQVQYGDPYALPLLQFKDRVDQDRFNLHDFDNLISAALSHRRDEMWVKSIDRTSYDDDMVWSFVRYNCTSEGAVVKRIVGGVEMWSCSMKHDSQPHVEFYINSDFVPEIQALC